MGVKYIYIYIVSHILTLTVAYLYIDCRISLHWLSHILTLTFQTYSHWQKIGSVIFGGYIIDAPARGGWYVPRVVAKTW